MGLLKTLKPSWWFTAHLHVKFDAGVKYGTQGQQEKGGEEVDNPDEITIELDEEEKAERCAVNPDEIVLDENVEPVIATGTAPVPQQTYVGAFASLACLLALSCTSCSVVSVRPSPRRIVESNTGEGG